MKLEDIKTVSVFGAGLMGSGIAHVMALNGYKVYMRDINQELVKAGLDSIKKNMQRAAEKSLLTNEQVNKAVAAIIPTTDIAEAARAADFVVEAIPEKLVLKQELFREIDNFCKPETIFATNTSTLSITEVGSATKRPDKFIGMHFFNPVPIMELVEIIKGIVTSPETIKTTEELAAKLGKQSITVVNSPGFVVSRLGIVLFQEASRILQEGLALPDAIDRGLKLGYRHRMGPFETVDLVGLDARLNNLNALWESTLDPTWRPPQLLKSLVAAGYLGKKRGSRGGYYTYFGLEK